MKKSTRNSDRLEKEAPASPRYEMKPHAPWPTGQPLHPRPLSEPDAPLIRVLDASSSTMLCSTGLRLHRALQHRVNTKWPRGHSTAVIPFRLHQLLTQ